MNYYAKEIAQMLTKRDRLEYLAEEASGLTQAALKLIRAEGYSGNYTPESKEEALQNLFEKFVDVQMVMRCFVDNASWQLLTHIDSYPKWKRWHKQLKEGKHNASNT